MTLNAWPNVDISVSFEESVQARNVHLLTTKNFVLTCLNISVSFSQHQMVSVMAEFGRSLANLYFVFISNAMLQFLLKADAFSP